MLSADDAIERIQPAVAAVEPERLSPMEAVGVVPGYDIVTAHKMLSV